MESLLAQPASGEDFLGEPALAMARDSWTILPRRRSRDSGSGCITFSTSSALAAWARYRARDTKLGRDVALKVLPRLFSADPERLARFEREARLLASLNHPHIAAIYGFEETSGVHALVLELVEGPTLAERLQRGPCRWPRR